MHRPIPREWWRKSRALEQTLQSIDLLGPSSTMIKDRAEIVCGFCLNSALTGSPSGDKDNLVFEEVLLEDRVIGYENAIEMSVWGFVV